ncbi:BNR repeat-containing protein [Polaribacter sp. L3A8]|uniref:BNR repeat-containing protein n=1 Tax=Polaribacter sp. L3A8 TaxID=2686361 RepID=UPI00131B5361|nr:BNR repeat-containing protein [Polaribacter sp. L3A8]
MNLSAYKILLVSTFCLVLICPVFSQVKVVKEYISVVDKNALIVNGRFSSGINGRTFQKDALISHKGFQYLVHYNADRRVCLSRRKLPNGSWNTIQFLDYHFKSNDSHNCISMGICPNDGTIHLAFDHHVDDLHYRVSKKGLANNPETMAWNVAAFGPIISELEKDKPIVITYPKFWQTPDGNLQFNYRVRGSGNGDRMLVDYNAETGTWGNTHQIDSAEGIFKDQLGVSESRCSYPNGYDYDNNGILHTTWTWREDSQGANHDLVYVYSEDNGNSWNNNSGKPLENITQVNSPGVVVQSIPHVLGLMNDQGQTIDSKNQVHVVMYHSTEQTIKDAGSFLGETRWGPKEAKRYHHYWRDTTGKWHHFEMNLKVGNRPKIFADTQDNLIMIYAGNDNNNLVIATATAKNKWKDWSITHVVKGPFINDMLGDFYRWKNEGVLSIMVQDQPKRKRKKSTLKVVDLTFESKL